jgi:hypothetical protein
LSVGEETPSAAEGRVFFLRFFFGFGGFARTTLDAGRSATTAARIGELGANTPAKRTSGKRGGGMRAAMRARSWTGVITRWVAPLRRGFRRKYATRPSGRSDMRSRLKGGLAPYRQRRLNRHACVHVESIDLRDPCALRGRAVLVVDVVGRAPHAQEGASKQRELHARLERGDVGRFVGPLFGGALVDEAAAT